MLDEVRFGSLVRGGSASRWFCIVWSTIEYRVKDKSSIPIITQI